MFLTVKKNVRIKCVVASPKVVNTQFLSIKKNCYVFYSYKFSLITLLTYAIK